LETAKNPHLEILLSNTTEAGLVEDQGDIGDNPPASFAAKVTAYLYTRFCHFNGDPTKGLIIIPTELVPDNAQVLKEIILKITERQNLKPEFVSWITSAIRSSTASFPGVFRAAYSPTKTNSPLWLNLTASGQ
jgi:tagaturonate reductase